MPKIIISDRDYTAAAGNISTDYGVFVPGLAGVGATNPPQVAKEYRSLAAFVADVGKGPQVIGSNFTDMGYMYAAELLGAGLPVVYKCVPNLVTTLADQTDTPTITTASPSGTVRTATATLTKDVANNTDPGSTDFFGTGLVDFLDGSGNIISLVATDMVFTITVNSSKVLTLTETYGGTGTPSFLDLTTIVSIRYKYEPEGYVDPNEVTYEDICDEILTDAAFFNEVEDRGLYDVSFVTTGGYPTTWKSSADGQRKNVINKLVDVCAARGDCFALIDFEESMQLKFEDGIYEDADGNQLTEININTVPQDAFIIHPWCQFTPTYSGVANAFMFPGSFAFLRAFAGSIKSNNSWFATAGVRRGAVPCAGVSQIITTAEADQMQPTTGRSVNDIIYIKPYGYTIYGNRTLFDNKDGLVANSFINVRQLVHEIKRNVYVICKGLMFDPNDDILWVNFKNAVTPLLEKMRSGQGIKSFRLVKIQSSARGTMTAKIIIVPIEAVETFDITVELTDEDIAVVG